MDRGATEGIGVVELGGRSIEYRFARRRRRTLGLSVDAHGLKVVAPLRAPWREIDAFLRDKRRWILAKLDEWARVPRRPVLRGARGELVPLFGDLVELERNFDSAEKLVRWLKRLALDALQPRVRHYAALLGRPEPRLAISSARTQWGVCTEDGTIRLSWRLVHVEPALADYVVAHESAHLVELNHSRRFYEVLDSLYPGWPQARERLELAGAALPIIQERTR
ncbi:MAG TPA: SprT family zinc-dependent metalloprotease [Burkholderiales bacterium]